MFLQYFNKHGRPKKSSEGPEIQQTFIFLPKIAKNDEKGKMPTKNDRFLLQISTSTSEKLIISTIWTSGL